MPYKAMPTFKAIPDKMLEMPQPGIGGLNLKDLEFEQEVNQSPFMMNVMYRNGAFGKRFGQEVHSTYENKVYATTYFGGNIYVHSGTKIYKYNPNGTHTDVSNGINFPAKKGLFIVYAQKLYYLISSGFYQLKDNGSFGTMDTYIPEVLINCKPDGTHSDAIDEYNILGSKFSIIYNGEAGVTAYKVPEAIDLNNVKWAKADIKIEIDDDETTAFSISNQATRTITFNTAPGAGNLNVVVTFTLKDDVFVGERSQLLNCKFYDTFGGANNSRLFLAGGGYSKYFYSAAYDISYFPESNFATLGNTEEDITGFGRQYNVLIIFKPREVYSIYSFVETASSTVVEENIGLEGFKSQLVNPRVGCDAPNTIQLINNQLTWFNSNEGICTLVSTNIVDERNVRVISRNIERTNNFGIQRPIKTIEDGETKITYDGSFVIKGILDYNEPLESIQSTDYNNKYFLVFPESGYCYMWDYEISPYRFSSNGGETPPKQLDWYLFNKFYAGEFLKCGKELLYVCAHTNYNKSLIKLNASFSDVNFENERDEHGNILDKVAIHSFYTTPFMQFGAVESLKNVKNIYVQCRGDTASVIDMYYYTEDALAPEPEGETIRIGGRLWSHFTWSTFQWFTVNYAYTFRRKCNLKKIQMASFYFENNEVDRDMSITHIGLQYQIVKYVR